MEPKLRTLSPCVSAAAVSIKFSLHRLCACVGRLPFLGQIMRGQIKGGVRKSKRPPGLCGWNHVISHLSAGLAHPVTRELFFPFSFCYISS